MNKLLSPFVILAAIGLFLSLTVHLYAILGKTVPFGSLAWGLHGGIFIVWIPAVLIGNKLSKDFKQKDLWKAMLRGCPVWMKRITYFFFGYAALNFLLFMYLEHTAKGGSGKEVIVFRGFSGHWMAFYSAAMSILYSATQADKFDKERRCRNGHPVTPSAKYCEECGAPVLEHRY